MKKLIPLIIFIVGIVIFPFLFLTTASASDPPITIRLLSDKTIYQPGEPIKMQIEVLSTQAIITRKGFFDQPFHLMITFIDPDGKPINSSYLQPGNEPGPPYRVDDRDAVLAENIQNGASKTIVLDNAYALYDLTKSGRYTAQVFTSLETFSQSSTDPFGNLIAFLDDAGKQSFSPTSNKISFETASPAPGPLSVLAPNGGDILPTGGTYAICWRAPSNVVKFDLLYTTNGTDWIPINTVTGVNCVHWEIPVVTANKKQCRVKVIGYDSANVKEGEDISDKPFTIEVLKVTSPNGGETLKSGNTWTIKWVTHKTIRPVAKTVLKYTINGGTTWKAIKTLTGNPESYDWTVPSVLSTKTRCKIKVILKDASGVNIGANVSNKVFTIQP